MRFANPLVRFIKSPFSKSNFKQALEDYNFPKEGKSRNLSEVEQDLRDALVEDKYKVLYILKNEFGLDTEQSYYKKGQYLFESNSYVKMLIIYSCIVRVLTCSGYQNNCVKFLISKKFDRHFFYAFNSVFAHIARNFFIKFNITPEESINFFMKIQKKKKVMKNKRVSY